MATQIQLRRDSYSNWNSANPVLAQGEIGCVISGTDTGLFKIGDGVTTWNFLSYATDFTKIANKHTVLANGTTALALASSNSVVVTPTANASYTTTVPVAGTRAAVMILTSGTTSYTITFSTGFKAASTIVTGAVTGKYWVVNFISDGTNLIEMGRSGPV